VPPHPKSVVATDRLASAAARYIPGALAPAAGNFALTVALAHMLRPAEFGLFAVAWSIVTIVAAAGSQWIVQAVNRFVPGKRARASVVTGSAAVAGSYAAVVSSGIAILSFTAYARYAGEVYAVAWLQAGVGLGAAAAVACHVYLGLLQSSFQAARYSAVQLQFQLARCLGGIAGAAIAGTAAGALAGAAAASGPIIVRLWGCRGVTATHVGDRERRRRWTGNLWTYGFPFIGWSLLSTSLAVGDRILIGLLVGQEAVASYTVHYALATGCATLLATPLLLAAHPEVMKRWSNGDQLGGRRMAARLAILVASCGAAVTTASAIWGQSIVAALFGAEYRLETAVLPVLCASVFIWQVGLYAQKPLEAQGRTLNLVVAMSWAVGVNVVANVLLLPRMSVMGAAIATLLGYVSYTGVTWVIAWTPRAPLAVRASLVAVTVLCMIIFGVGRLGAPPLTIGALAGVALLPVLLHGTTRNAGAIG
jgi:O-antigen/teichoic acid export membrane protein